MLSAEGEFAAVEAVSGKALGPRVTPRTGSKALSLTLLDAEGKLCGMQPASLELDWASNDTVRQSSRDSESLGECFACLNHR